MGSVTDELGLRERKKLERRRCIEAVAIDLFELNGFEGTTIDDIATKADIAPRTFFSYYDTKEDVVLADYATRLQRILEELRQRPAGEAPWPALRASFVVVAADYDAHREELGRRFAIMAQNPSVYARSLQLQSGWEDALTDVLTGRIGDNDDIEPRLLAAAALACMRSSLRHWQRSGRTTTTPELVDDCFERLANGLDPDPRPPASPG